MHSSLRAGTALIDITPPLGTSVAGFFYNRTAANIHDPVHARCLVLEEGSQRIAIVVCDLVAIGFPQASDAKHMIHGHTGIPMQNILISATHTHSGPTPMSIFQAEPDPHYQEWLVTRIADGVRCAAAAMKNVEFAHASASEPSLCFNRRYYMKPGTIHPNPFGQVDGVKMNPGEMNPNIVKPAGPTDPELAMLGLRTPAGEPIALLASYSLHYVGNNPELDVSADYFGMWAQEVSKTLQICDAPGPQEGPAFLPMLANACSGDINNIDVTRHFEQPFPYAHMRDAARTLAGKAADAWKQMKFHSPASLAMREAYLELKTRRPTAAEIDRAKGIIASAGSELKASDQVYARETLLMKDWPETVTLPMQAIRLGDLGIVTFPGEAFVEIGLEVKRKSPFKQTLCIELANAFGGYIPTAKAHELGGYETWRARTSFLEIDAAQKMTVLALRLLSEVKSAPASLPA